MKNKFENAAYCFAIALSLSACATTSLTDHQKKYQGVTLEKLLAGKDVPAADKEIMESALAERTRRDFEDNDYVSSLRHAKMTLEMSPDNYDVRYFAAESLLFLSKPKQAEEQYLQILKRSQNAKLHQGYGLSLLAQNKHKEAQKWLNKAVLQSSDLWRSWNGLGIIYDASGDWPSAEAAYKAAMASSAQNPTVYNNLGMSYLQQDRIVEALIVFENARNLKGTKSYSDLYYRTALALSGDMERALEGTTDDAAANLYNQLGIHAIKSGKQSDAIQYLKLAIAKSPSYHAEAEKNLTLAESKLP